VSDAIDKTAAGATRTFFGALAFILLMVGVEKVTGHVSISWFSGAILMALGAICFYLAFFWESAKRFLSVDAQEAIERFSQSRIVRFGMLCLVIEAVIMSRFFEEQRWPFSYPTDPAVITENNKLKNDLNSAKGDFSRERESAEKWRFAKALREAAPNCHYQLVVKSPFPHIVAFWHELLQTGGWLGDRSGPQNLNLIQPGITLRIPIESTACATALQRALTDFYPNPPSKIAPNQPPICGNDCVLIEMNY
jgi:hypothetical protein